MRIVIATFTYPPLADGVSEHAKVLAEGLARRGHSVTVATEFHPERAPTAGPKVEQFRISGQGHWRFGIKAAPGEAERYRQFLREFPCDVMVFSCWDMWSTHLALPVLHGIRAKKILASHGYATHIRVPQPRPPWGLVTWFAGWPLVMRAPLDLRKFDQLVVLSPRAGFDRFFDHWLARATGYEKVSVIPNGAFARDFAGELPDFRAAHNLGSGPLVLYVANYGDRKNQTAAVRAFRRAQISEGTLVLIGGKFNEYSAAVEQLDRQLCADYPAGRVLMLEKVSREMTCAAFRTADLFLLSAKAETQPIVLIEAMASRTPFLSTDVGCVREMPGGVVVSSETEMAEELRNLIASPERRKRLAEEGYRACETTYDWNRVLDAYEQLFSRLTASKDPG